MGSVIGFVIWAVDKPPKPLSTRGNFFIYLSAFLCFVLAAMGEGWRFGARTRSGLAPRIVLIPLGLALFVLPQVIACGRGFRETVRSARCTSVSAHCCWSSSLFSC